MERRRKRKIFSPSWIGNASGCTSLFEVCVWKGPNLPMPGLSRQSVPPLQHQDMPWTAEAIVRLSLPPEAGRARFGYGTDRWVRRHWIHSPPRHRATRIGSWASPWRPSWVVSRRRTTSPLLPPHRLTLRGSFGKSDGTIACQCPWRKMMIALQASRRRVTEKRPIHMQSRSLPPFVDMPLDWVASRSIPPVDMLPPLRSITPGGCGMWKRAELSYFYRMGCGRNATASVCIPMEVFAPPPISEAPSSAGTSGRANRPVTSPVLTPDEFCAPSSRRMVFSWPRRAMTVPSRSGI
mmetsp:Transcript_25774/g.60252  ORF Transcript_25774/g.60252 Transcript_25774/m.60252 type:complete len:294 (+) Transcript_25774:267-1148(+)